MVCKRMVASLVMAALTGCANLNSIYRPLALGETASAVAVDVKQRAIYSVPRHVTSVNGSNGADIRVICAEPSPDSLSAYSASGGLTNLLDSASQAGNVKDQAQAAFAAGEAAASIGLRTQSIQLLRDGLFSNCLAYLNAAVDGDQFYELQRRSQNFTLGLLAIEQLTGAVKADQAALGTSSSAATGSDNTDKEAAALATAQKNQNDAKTALALAQAAVKDAQAAVSDQQAKVAEAKKKQSDLKNPDDAAKKAAQEEVDSALTVLATRQKDSESRRITMDSAIRDVANADSQVAIAQESLLAAQMRVRASTTGTAQLVSSGGARAAVTDRVAGAVTDIVKAVLESSGDEACWSMLDRLNEADPTKLVKSPLFQVFTSRCDQAAKTVLARDIVVKTTRSRAPVSNELRKALPQINRFLSE